MDWAVENVPPATFYQHCLPRTFRYLNTVGDHSSEVFDTLNSQQPRTTDQWETAHFQSMTGQWEDEAGLLKKTGFQSTFLAEEIWRFKIAQGVDADFPTTFGYFDEGSLSLLSSKLMEDSLPFMWRYLDSVNSRNPKNRVYLGWMSSTTHTPLILPDEWLSNNYRTYLKKTGDANLWRNREHLPMDSWLNALRWTDDIVRDIIMGFRERGLEDETLFVMY